MAVANHIQIEASISKGEFHLNLKFGSSDKVTALFGPSGSGKTSALRIIAGLDQPDCGAIKIGESFWFDDANGTNIPPHKRGCGYVFQHSALFPHLSVEKNISYSEWAVGKSGSFDLEQIVELLGLSDLMQRYPSVLSGGERQRVALARALMSSPRILLFDEPFAGLDEARKLEIFPFIEMIKSEFDIPIIYVSHSPREVARLADKVVLLERGKVTKSGSVAEIFASDQFEGFTLLMGQVAQTQDRPGFDKILIENQTFLIGSSALSPGAQVRLAISPGEVILASEIPRGISAQNCIRVAVASIQNTCANSVMVKLRIGDQILKSKISKAALSDMQLDIGSECYAIIKAMSLADQRL